MSPPPGSSRCISRSYSLVSWSRRLLQPPFPATPVLRSLYIRKRSTTSVEQSSCVNSVIPHPILKRRKWSPAEDAIVLGEVQRAHLAGQIPRWTHIGKLVGRCAAGVFRRWKNCLDKSFNRGAWTEVEDCALANKVQAYQLAGLDRIPWATLSLDLHRSPASVRSRWCHHLDPDVLTTPWTAGEDESIRQEGTRAMIARESANWKDLKLKRSTCAISSRWWRLLHPNYQRGRWSALMNRAVLEEVQQASKQGRPINWSEVGRKIGKSADNVRTKWRECLDPVLRRGPWTLQETRWLLDRRELGLSWVELAAELRRGPGATRIKWHHYQNQIDRK